MQRNFLQVKEFLEQHYPELRGNISGGHYPPPPTAVFMMQALQYVHVATIVFLFMGDKIWSYIPGFQNGPPNWYQTCKMYPMQTLLFIFFFLPTILQSSMTTGAFEIDIDGKTVFSRLESKRFPTGDELIELFDTALGKK
jgi:selT/selW/selH-like putative selenoprotein